MPRNLPYSRADRIAKQVYQVIANFFYKEIADERLQGVQITNVKMTKDLSIARIYFYVEGDAKRQEVAKTALEEKAGSLKHAVAHELLLKIVPKLEFFPDEGTVNAIRVDELLDSLHSKT